MSDEVYQDGQRFRPGDTVQGRGVVTGRPIYGTYQGRGRFRDEVMVRTVDGVKVPVTLTSLRKAV